MLNSIFSETASSVELSSILLCSIISIILGIVIALTHKQTSKYNKNFLVTLSILPLLVQTIIIMVNGNLGTSVAIMGAFSLVRFRSLPGTSKEILSVFFAMTVGLATGMGHLVFAIIITIIGSLAIFILSKVALFNKNKKEKVAFILKNFFKFKDNYAKFDEMKQHLFNEDVILIKKYLNTNDIKTSISVRYYLDICHEKAEKEDKKFKTLPIFSSVIPVIWSMFQNNDLYKSIVMYGMTAIILWFILDFFTSARYILNELLKNNDLYRNLENVLLVEYNNLLNEEMNYKK